MELTGKCKEEFEKWYFKDFEFNEEITNFDRKITLSIFYTEKDSMKYGAFVDYFDSVKINADIQPVYNYTKENYSSIDYFIINVIELGKEDYDYKLIEEKNRPKARAAAIKEANELRNEVLNK
tara:strand:- start:169 stop:537 length:369 start_codon:yes stop_codon:yes gene_type:complete